MIISVVFLKKCIVMYNLYWEQLSSKECEQTFNINTFHISLTGFL